MKRLGKYVGIVTFWFIATMLLMEMALRLVPEAIPAPLLLRFQDELRSRIAGDRGFQTQDQTTAMLRDDEGPELRVWKPHAVITYPDVLEFARDSDAVLSVTMDEAGFCNPPGLYSSAEQFDLISVGDSFTWCLAVAPEDTFTLRLGAALGRPAYNLGRGGIGPYEYLQILKRFGTAKKPKVVLLNVYEGNDLRDAAEYWAAASPAPASGDEAAASRLVGLRDSLREGLLGRHSYSFNLLLAAGSALHSRMSGADAGAEATIDFRYRVRLRDGEVEFNGKNMDVDEVQFARRALEGEIDFGLFADALWTFVELGRADGFQPVVTYIPSAHVAYADQVTFNDPELAPLMQNFSLEMRGFFAQQSTEIGYQFVDLTETLHTAAGNSTVPSLLYYPTNLHLTRDGHAVIAGALERSLALRLEAASGDTGTHSSVAAP